MKNRKKIIIAFTSLMVVLLMSVSVFAASITPKQAADKALSDAGLSSTQVTKLKTKTDDGDYEVRFFDPASAAKYEYEISSKSGRIKESSVEYIHTKNTSLKKISKAKAYKAVAAASGIKKSVVKSGTIRLKKENGEWVYKIKFRYGSCRYEYEILAATGMITEIEKEYKK